MDKTVEVIVVAALVMVVALILVYLVQGQSGVFGDILGDQSKGASCKVEWNKYKAAVDCSSSPPSDTSESTSIKNDHQSECTMYTWTPNNACS